MTYKFLFPFFFSSFSRTKLILIKKVLNKMKSILCVCVRACVVGGVVSCAVCSLCGAVCCCVCGFVWCVCVCLCVFVCVCVLASLIGRHNEEESGNWRKKKGT